MDKQIVIDFMNNGYVVNIFTKTMVQDGTKLKEKRVQDGFIGDDKEKIIEIIKANL